MIMITTKVVPLTTMSSQEIITIANPFILICQVKVSYYNPTIKLNYSLIYLARTINQFLSYTLFLGLCYATAHGSSNFHINQLMLSLPIGVLLIRFTQIL